MLSLKQSYLCLLMIAPVSSFAANTCITVNGGWPNGGTTFVAPELRRRAKGACAAFSGFAKVATTVILQTSGSGCLSNDGKVLTFSLASASPNWVGIGNFQAEVTFARARRPPTARWETASISRISVESLPR